MWVTSSPSREGPDVEREPLLDVVARARRWRRRPSSTSSGSASARKPTWPRLTPSTGVRSPRQLGPAQERAVAAEHHDELAAGGRPLSPSTISIAGRTPTPRRRGRPPPGRAAGPRCRRGQRLAEAGADLAGRVAAGVRQQQDAPGRARRAAGGPSRRQASRGTPGTARAARPGTSVAGASARAAATGRTRRCRTAPGSGLAATARAPQPRSARRSGDRRHRLGPQLRVADHPALADAGPCPTSNCGLTISTRSAVRRRARRPAAAAPGAAR